MLQHSKLVKRKKVRKIQLRIFELDSLIPKVVSKPTDKKQKLHTTNRKNVVSLMLWRTKATHPPVKTNHRKTCVECEEKC